MTNNKNEKKLAKRVNKQDDYREEERTPIDKYEDQKFADDIPLEDLKIEAEQERNKHKTQDASQSTNKYRADFKRSND